MGYFKHMAGNTMRERKSTMKSDFEISSMPKIADRDLSVDLMRSFLVILVVLGHATYYTVTTDFGGIYISEAMDAANVADTVFHRITIWVTSMIYSFHMPAFVAISGILFQSQMEKNRFKSLGQLLRNKTQRLILPFLFVWLVWNIPIKAFAGYYSGISFPYVLLQILRPNNVYLWYLETLFFDFLIAYAICYKFKTLKQQALIVFPLWGIGIILIQYTVLDAFVGYPFKFLLWFWMGMNLNNALFSKLNRRDILLILCLLFVAFFMVSMLISYVARIINNTILPMLGILITYIVCKKVAQRFSGSERWKAQLLKFSGCSFGIYLWAEPLNYAILYIFQKNFGVEYFGLEGGAALVWALRVFITPLIAILITKLLRKTNFFIKAY